MNILDTIITTKKKEVQKLKELKPIKLLEQSIFFHSLTISLKAYLQREDRLGIIAEIKRGSPSAGIINDKVDIEKLSIAYMQSGASALSVLTDKIYFNGTNEDLTIARKYNYCPILRKEFIIDEYQVIESKSIGADCILLIAACISSERCKDLAALAKSLGLEVLLEVRTRTEIDSHTNEYIDIIGVNNRNLQDFKTAISNSLELAPFLPPELIKISESGITHADQIIALQNEGYNGFLIGSHFMKDEEPGRACKLLIESYKTVAL